MTNGEKDKAHVFCHLSEMEKINMGKNLEGIILFPIFALSKGEAGGKVIRHPNEAAADLYHYP